MPVSWDGACAALKTAFLAGWRNGSPLKTPVGFTNEKILDVDATTRINVAPPVGADGAPVPWAFFCILGNGGSERGAGLVGNKTWLDLGLISISVFAPKGYGLDEIKPMAVAAGEIFRAQTFYRDDSAGAKVVCYAPSIDDGFAPSQTPSGDQFPVTCSIPFEFFYVK